MKSRFRSSFYQRVLPCMTATLILLAATAAHAGSLFTVTMAQMGPDVVATGSGTIDLTGLTLQFSSTFNTELYPAHGILGTGPFANVDDYFGLSGPASFGPGFGGFPSSTSGDHVALEDFALDVQVPQGYVSGAPLASSATYAGTISSLNLTPGTYTWTWNAGANSFVLVVPAIPTPEPGTLVLLASGLLGTGAAVRKRLVATSQD